MALSATFAYVARLSSICVRVAGGQELVWSTWGGEEARKKLIESIVHHKSGGDQRCPQGDQRPTDHDKCFHTDYYGLAGGSPSVVVRTVLPYACNLHR